MALEGPIFRSESRAPRWSDAGSGPIPTSGRSSEEQVNRIVSTLATRLNVNINMLRDVVNDVMASDWGERPIDLVNHIVEGLRERGAMNRARLDEIQRNPREFMMRIR